MATFLLPNCCSKHRLMRCAGGNRRNHCHESQLTDGNRWIIIAYLCSVMASDIRYNCRTPLKDKINNFPIRLVVIDEEQLLCLYQPFCNYAVLSRCVIVTVRYCYMALLLRGAIVTWRYCYTALLLHGVIVTWRYCYTALLLQGIIVTRRYCFTALLWCGIIVTWRCCNTMVFYHRVIETLGYCNTMLF